MAMNNDDDDDDEDDDEGTKSDFFLEPRGLKMVEPNEKKGRDKKRLISYRRRAATRSVMMGKERLTMDGRLMLLCW